MHRQFSGSFNLGFFLSFHQREYRAGLCVPIARRTVCEEVGRMFPRPFQDFLSSAQWTTVRHVLHLAL